MTDLPGDDSDVVTILDLSDGFIDQIDFPADDSDIKLPGETTTERHAVESGKSGSRKKKNNAAPKAAKARSKKVSKNGASTVAKQRSKKITKNESDNPKKQLSYTNVDPFIGQFVVFHRQSDVGALLIDSFSDRWSDEAR
jgi:hypothetical protein